MSRIEQALKRAAARGGPSDPPERFATGTEAAVLELYPLEHRVGDSPSPIQRREAISAFGPVHVERSGERRLALEPAAGSMAAEQYRRLAAALHELQVARSLKTVMVTSALPQEGKTLTVSNLALTLSGSYNRRVLLIDADLRRPTIHEVLHLPNASGLSDLLASDGAAMRVIEAAPRLHVVPAGRPTGNPMAALTSDRMRAFLKHAETAYDWVLLDAPPVGIMPDAGLLAGMTGATLFVIAAGSTPYPVIQRALEELGRECVIGTVLNRVDERSIPATDYYHAHYGPATRNSKGELTRLPLAIERLPPARLRPGCLHSGRASVQIADL